MKGTLLDGQRGVYRLEGVLGDGAYGVVHKATDSGGQVVAIKVLLDDKNQDARIRLMREIQIVSQLNHENIIQILDYGVGPDNIYWFAMPFMANGSLDKILQNPKAQFSASKALRLIRGIADGLAVYHDHDGIHRDIKPENILVHSDGTPKLADFGVGRCPRLTQGNMTCTALGTPNYMAPEHRKNEACSKSDIYSLGIVLWELLHWKRHINPHAPPQFAMSLGQGVKDLYDSMVQLNHVERPDARMVSQQCAKLTLLLTISEFQKRPATVPTQTSTAPMPAATQKSNNSGWGWLLAAAGGLLVLGAATSNEWDGDTRRYRGSDGRFRSGRWG